MKHLTSEVLRAWGEREGPVVLSTVGTDGMPNSIYATCVELSDDELVVIADNYFSKTKQNIEQGSPASVLFITGEGKAYQIKGKVEYYKTGTYYDFMKSWNPKEHPGHGALVITPQEIYKGKKKLFTDN
ncbi:MAG: pyridoxamine 5'-phosphate oxidase family protein [Spirochaetota bacterium]